jgi:AraC-like DNA-binding protein
MALDEYVLRRRIERALDLMKNSKASDSEIGVQIGLGAASVFRSVFLGYLGLSPAEYRRSLSRNIRLRMPGDNNAVNGV